jgi:hypothetical protein
MERTDFPSADAKYRALVEASVREGVRVQERMSNYTATDEISATEPV